MSMTPQERTAVGLLDVMNEHVVTEASLWMSSVLSKWHFSNMNYYRNKIDILKY